MVIQSIGQVGYGLVEMICLDRLMYKGSPISYSQYVGITDRHKLLESVYCVVADLQAKNSPLRTSI